MNSKNAVAATIAGIWLMASPLAQAQQGPMDQVIDGQTKPVMTGFGDCLRTPSAGHPGVGCPTDQPPAVAIPEPERIPPKPVEQPPVEQPAPVVAQPIVAPVKPPVKTPKKIKVVELPKADVLFAFGTSKLSPAGTKVIADIAEDIHKESSTYPPAYAIRIRAHTDRLGSKSYNVKLSEARARAVTTEMQKHGLPQEKLYAEGVGSEESLVGDKCDHIKPHTGKNKALVSCMQPDRRAEIEVSDSAPTDLKSEAEVAAAKGKKPAGKKIVHPKKKK